MIEGLYDDAFGQACYGVFHRVDKAAKWGSFLLAAARADSRWRFFVRSVQLGPELETEYLDSSAPTAQDVDALVASAKALGREIVASRLHRASYADLEPDVRREVDAVVTKAVAEEARLLDRRVIDVLGEDVVALEDVVNAEITVDLSQDEFDALISFVFNLGPRALRRSGLAAAINAGEWRSGDPEARAQGIAAVEAGFIGVRHALGDDIASVLTGRRGREAEKFLREARGALERSHRA